MLSDDVIDQSILAHATIQWRKVAMIVGLAMLERDSKDRGQNDEYYAERVLHLIKMGHLEVQGDITKIRFCEARLVTKS